MLPRCSFFEVDITDRVALLTMNRFHELTASDVEHHAEMWRTFRRVVRFSTASPAAH